MSSTAPNPASVEGRVRSLADELFDASDLAASELTTRTKARSAAFILLAHAEIEHAIEEQCRQTAGLLREAMEPATAMLAWGLTAVNPEGGLQTPKVKMPYEALIKRYNHLVTSNNGVKEESINTLLIPLGVDLTGLKTDIQVLEGFGRRRGGLAHMRLDEWGTKDLASAHRSDAIQAGRAADNVISAIRAGHSRIVLTTNVQPVGWKQWVANRLRKWADRLG